MPEEFVAIIIVPSLFLLVGLMFWLWQRSAERRAQMRYDLGARTLERFSTADEMSKFLDTDAGKRFMRILEDGERRSGPGPLERLLRPLKIGTVLGCFGFGFVVLGMIAPDEEFVYPGVIFLSLGVGFVAASLVARKLSESETLTTEVREITRSPYRDAA